MVATPLHPYPWHCALDHDGMIPRLTLFRETLFPARVLLVARPACSLALTTSRSQMLNLAMMRKHFWEVNLNSACQFFRWAGWQNPRNIPMPHLDGSNSAQGVTWDATTAQK